MATSSSSMLLDAGSSWTDERKNEDLQPISYAEIVREGPTEAANETTIDMSGSSNPNDANRRGGLTLDQHANGSMVGIEKGLSVLQTINTHNKENATMDPDGRIGNKDEARDMSARSKSNGNSANVTEPTEHESRPSIERQESKHEYSATVHTGQTTT